MPIATYSDLQTSVQTWMDRNDIAGEVQNMISLAEAKLNRKLKVVESDASLTGVAGSRNLDVSSLSIMELISLHITQENGDERIVIIRPVGAFDYLDMSSSPGYVGLDEGNLVFDAPLDQPYAFRLRYKGRFALSDTVTTNKLLRDHPDVYMAATIAWGGLLTQDDRKIATWKALLDEALPEVSIAFNDGKNSELTVDPMLSLIGRRRRDWDYYR